MVSLQKVCLNSVPQSFPSLQWGNSISLPPVVAQHLWNQTSARWHYKLWIKYKMKLPKGAGQWLERSSRIGVSPWEYRDSAWMSFLFLWTLGLREDSRQPHDGWIRCRKNPAFFLGFSTSEEIDWRDSHKNRRGRTEAQRQSPRSRASAPYEPQADSWNKQPRTMSKAPGAELRLWLPPRQGQWVFTLH